jgi:hypothetical protein
MAKITNKIIEQFADVSPTDKLAQFGSYKEGAATYSADPDTIQALENFGHGMTDALVNNCPLFIQEIDALCNLLARQARYLMQAGIPEYNADTVYYIGSLVNDGANNIYMSVADDNTGNAFTDDTYWTPYISKKVRTTSSNFEIVANDDYYLNIGPTTDAYPVLVILPTPSAANIGRRVIVDKLFSAGTGNVQVQAADSSTIEGAAYLTITAEWATKTFVSDGTNWLVI